ncbi:MAG: hypothetical protein KDB37_21240 [Ilumatobacter sp.]|nr:hypothetical protein [Ilumatobacter sp.]
MPPTSFIGCNVTRWLVHDEYGDAGDALFATSDAAVNALGGRISLDGFDQLDFRWEFRPDEMAFYVYRVARGSVAVEYLAYTIRRVWSDS